MAKAKFRRMIDSSSGSEGATIEIRNVENKEQIGATFTYIVGAVNSPKQKFTPDSSRGFIAFWLESVRIIFHVEITEISEVLCPADTKTVEGQRPIDGAVFLRRVHFPNPVV